MRTLASNFFKGLLVIVPLAVTIYVAYLLVSTIDGFLSSLLQADLPPGVGVVSTLIFVTIVGASTSSVIGKRVVELLEETFSRLPFVKILYGSLKDLMGAFVGDKKSFDKPVVVDLSPGNDGSLKVFGFVTCEVFEDASLDGNVAVYLPQSYNFAGNLIIVPRANIRPVDADGAQFMAFILSGGVSGMHAARTIADPAAAEKLLAAGKLKGPR